MLNNTYIYGRMISATNNILLKGFYIGLVRGIESPPSEEITVRIDAPGTVYMYVVQFSMCYQTFDYIF